MLFAELISFKQLMPFAIFGMIAAVAWWALNFLAAKRPRAEERLDELKDGGRKRRAEEVIKESSTVSSVLEKTTPTLARPLRPTNDADADKLKNKLSAAGYRNESAQTVFLGMKLVGLIAGFVLCGGMSLLYAGISLDTVFYTVIGAGAGLFLPNVVLWFFTKSRRDQIFYGLPDALDLMVVCVEAGLGLDQAMRKVSEEMKKTYRVIAEEFQISNFQIQMGRRRAEVLQELGARTQVDDLRALAAILIQADKFGSSIAQALRVQSDSMRTRRQQLAEEKAAKTAVKLIFPLVIFIFPGIFVVLVGPAAIMMVRELFKAMGG